MADFTLSTRPPEASHTLPLTLMTLESWALVSVQGPDSTSYLQGKLTLDVHALATEQHQLSAHCDAKGKVWSTLQLFHYKEEDDKEEYAYLLRRSVLERQLAELKKYAVFSKATITADDTAVLLGLAGHNARAALSTVFDQLPDHTSPLVHTQDSTVLWFATPHERFLIITNAHQAALIRQRLSPPAHISHSDQWLALEIEAGRPVVDIATSNQFIPQAANLQVLDAISFKKGCYTGQEIVARAKYRGANKRALYWLAGKAGQLPEAGAMLEQQLGENWRKTGLVLAAVRMADNTVWVQAILNQDLAPEVLFRVSGDANSRLTCQPLPYSLTEQT